MPSQVHSILRIIAQTHLIVCSVCWMKAYTLIADKNVPHQIRGFDDFSFLETCVQTHSIGGMIFSHVAKKKAANIIKTMPRKQ